MAVSTYVPDIVLTAMPRSLSGPQVMWKPIFSRTFSPDLVPQLPETVPSWFKFPNLSTCAFLIQKSPCRHFKSYFCQICISTEGVVNKKHGPSDYRRKCHQMPIFQITSIPGPGGNDPIYRFDLFLPPTVTMEISRPPHRPLASPGIGQLMLIIPVQK